MAISYTWSIQKLYTKDITEGGQTYSDVIKRTVGILKGTDSGEEVIHGFDVDLRNPSSWSDFTEYASLSEANVVSFVETRIGSTMMAAIKTDMENRMATLLEYAGATVKGTDENPTFPWN